MSLGSLKSNTIGGLQITLELFRFLDFEFSDLMSFIVEDLNILVKLLSFVFLDDKTEAFLSFIDFDFDLDLDFGLNFGFGFDLALGLDLGFAVFGL